MIDVLILMAFNSLYCVGLHITTRKNHLFHFIDNNNWPDWVKKPLYDCPTCMASVHGSIVYWVVMEWTLGNLYIWPFYLFALCCLNTYVNNKVE